MNEIIKNIITRRSIRKYKPDMIPEEMINEIVKAGTYAPSGLGTQSPVILVIINKEMRDKLSELNARVTDRVGDPFYGAPVILVVLAEKKYMTHVQDGSVVMENLMLAAHSLGIGSCWIHGAKEEFELPEGKEILKNLGIAGEFEGIGHCILGYAEGVEPKAVPRKDTYVYYIK